MNQNITWETIMKTSRSKKQIKTPALVFIVAMLHIMAIGSFFFIQGCGPSRRPAIEPPRAPVVPIHQDKQVRDRIKLPPPIFQPAPPTRKTVPVKTWQDNETYKVKKGDSLSNIAKRFGVGWRELAEVNNISDPNKLIVGQKLVLPSYAKERNIAPPPPKKAEVIDPSATDYIVKPGDSLSKISVKHGTTVKAIREKNKLTSDKILIGQKLLLPGNIKPKKEKEVVQKPKPTPKPKPKPAPKPKPKPEIVTAPPPTEPPKEVISEPAPQASQALEDTLLAVEEEEISADDHDELSDLSADETYEYTVMENDTLDNIARSWVVLKSDLIKINNLEEDTVLVPGDKIIIPMPSVHD